MGRRIIRGWTEGLFAGPWHLIGILLTAAGPSATGTSTGTGASAGTPAMSTSATLMVVGILLLHMLIPGSYVTPVGSAVDIHRMSVSADEAPAPVIGNNGVKAEDLGNEDHYDDHNEQHCKANLLRP